MKAEAEVEAKLLARAPATLDAIAELRQVDGYRFVPRRRARLHTVYLDTPEFALLRAGVCLRTRRDGRRFEATIKWMGEVRGTIHERPELNVALPGAPGQWRALPEGALHEQLAAIVAGRRLAPILITEIERRRMDVFAPGKRRAGAPFAELALDRVRARSPRKGGRASAAYGELELELRHGRRAALAELARQLRREFDLAPTDETKFSRGLAVLYGVRAPQPRSLERPAGGDALRDAARKVLALQLTELRAHDPATRRGDDADALHRMRVAVRRARAALRAFGDGIAPSLRDELARELRWLSTVLGAVRDLDVQLATHEHAARSARGSARDALSDLCAHLRAERARARGLLARALDSRRYFALLVALEAVADGRAARAQGRAARASFGPFAAQAVERALADVERRGRKLRRRKRAPDAEELHALRIRVKRARYLLEFLGDLPGKPGRRTIARLTRLQERLGDHQDAVVAAKTIAAYAARARGRLPASRARALAELRARHERRAEDARNDFHAAWRAFERGRAQRDARKIRARLRASAGAERRER